MSSGRERRSSARIRAEFWVAVRGVDDAPQLRSGDISVTGCLFDHTKTVGAVGSVQWLVLDTRERDAHVEVMARVIRILTVDDLDPARRRTGYALEFMPQDAMAKQRVEQLVRRVIEQQLEEEIVIDIDHEFEATVGGRRAAVVPISVHRMMLDVDHPFVVGEQIEFDIKGGGRAEALHFTGMVAKVRARPGADGNKDYRIEVRVEDEAGELAPGAGDSIDFSVTDLLVSAPEHATILPREHLVGRLSRIGVPALLGLFEMERMSGELAVLGDSTARVYLRRGQIVDIELDGDRGDLPARELLAVVLGWQHGTFEFTMCDVDRKDRLGTSTTALLLDLARVQDEAAAPR